VAAIILSLTGLFLTPVRRDTGFKRCHCA